MKLTLGELGFERGGLFNEDALRLSDVVGIPIRILSWRWFTSASYGEMVEVDISFQDGQRAKLVTTSEGPRKALHFLEAGHAMQYEGQDGRAEWALPADSELWVVTQKGKRAYWWVDAGENPSE